MEKLGKRLQDLMKVLKQLETSINKLALAQKKQSDPSDIIIFRDSVIKRFELCYDLVWKCLKEFLEKEHGIEVASPKKVFQECFNRGLMNESELKEAFGMVDDRNQACHIYDESMAEEISKKMIKHYDLIAKFAQKIKI